MRQLAGMAPKAGTANKATSRGSTNYHKFIRIFGRAQEPIWRKPSLSRTGSHERPVQRIRWYCPPGHLVL